MRYAWFHWWWAEIGLARAQVVLNIIGALFAATALLYAWRVAKRQFAIMTDQDKLMNRQLELMKEETETVKRLESITNEQATILRRQGEIVEVQHKLYMRQLDERPILSLIFDPWETYQEADAKDFNVEVLVINEGKLAVSECTWFLYGSVINTVQGGKLAGSWPTIEGTAKSGWSGHVKESVSRGQYRKVGVIQIPKHFVRTTDGVKLWWYIDAAGARYPEGEEYGTYTLTVSQFKSQYQ